VAVVLGLGNPGSRYADTRHNVGYRVVETLADRWRAARQPDTGEYRWWWVPRAGRAVALLEPLTYMNRSGGAVAAWRARHGLEPDALLVVSDDVYLPVGALRLRTGGSAGGHRGLESIEAALGTRDWARLRVGVGTAGGAERLREHVLEQFGPDEMEPARAAEQVAAEAVESWVGEGVIAAMNRFNRRVRKEVAEP
jgi:PTH1 family peptidyl-tRNA hydrolase